MSRYKEKLDQIVWSFSSLRLYQQCPYAFYLRKIAGIKGESNSYAEIGSYGHELNERIFKKKCTVQEALDECVDEFDDHVISDMSSSSKEQKYIALCNYLSEFDESALERYEVLGVEMKLRCKIGDYNFIGFADLVLRDKKSKQVYLIDHKSMGHFLRKDGKPLKARAESLEVYSKQMYLYAYALFKKCGFYPDYIVWNHFLDDSVRTTSLVFDSEKLTQTLEWFKNTIEEIYNDETYDAHEEYAMCYMLCDYRNGLCEYKDDDEDD